MESFQPLVNLLTVLSTLSVAAERLANLLKLGRPELSIRRLTAREEKARERAISVRVLAVSVLLAVLVKANIFELLARMDAPWDTLGWLRHPVIRWPRGVLLEAAGSAVTGLAMGFGSKFWHDLLDIVYGARLAVRGDRSGLRRGDSAHNLAP